MHLIWLSNWISRNVEGRTAYVVAVRPVGAIRSGELVAPKLPEGVIHKKLSAMEPISLLSFASAIGSERCDVAKTWGD
jgi:hypothetical protein